MTNKMNKGEVMVYLAKGCIKLLAAAGENLNGGKLIEPVRGRNPQDWKAFAEYLMTTNKDGGLGAKYVHWLTLDADHEYEIAAREREARAAAREAVECDL